MAAYQYVYHMSGVSKTYPGGKKTFENIHLNFLPGVKIGVVGVNGAGKSTLLKTRISPAKHGPPRAPRSATCRRNPSSTRPRPCARTSWRAWPGKRPFWIATMNWR